jgi:hypothetical protein
MSDVLQIRIHHKLMDSCSSSASFACTAVPIHLTRGFARCYTILVRNRERELFCVSCDMFLREEPPADKEDPDLPSSAHPQALEPQQQHTSTAAMLPSQTGAVLPSSSGLQGPEISILDRQHEVAQQLSLSLLDKMLDISKEVTAARNTQECEQQLAILRSCINTYQSVAEELM